MERPDADSEGHGQIFTTRAVGLEQLGVSGQQRIATIAAANGSVLAAFQGGELIRWYPIENEAASIDFGRDVRGDVGRVLLEPKGFHALVTNTTGDSWYLNFNNNQAKALPKLKGHIIEAVSWDPDSTATSTRDMIVGTAGGQLLHVVIEAKDRPLRQLFVFQSPGESRPTSVSGVHRTRLTGADGSERTVVFAAAGCGVYAFIGTSLETVFQKYQGESAAMKALVYEVPRDTPHGDLQVANGCVGPPGTKVLFWLTGVGVLAANVKNPLEEDGSILESPPGLIPFPRSQKASPQTHATGGLVASLLPPPPPPAPLSMALTQYHIIFLFEDRWVVVSRITHEVVQQQDWPGATYGPLRTLIHDENGEKLWLCSERQIFEVTTDREDRNVWTFFLRLEQFEDALAKCTRVQQRTQVLATWADWLFRKGRLVESARKFAEANAVPFEHVALRFLSLPGGHNAALLEYFRCRLQRCPLEDQVTRALLGVWAIEISLANLNFLRERAVDAKGRAAVDVERTSLLELLKDCKDLDVHATIYHLLQSHGWLDELAIFAEARRDFITVILHHVSRRDCLSAIRKLADFQTAGAGEDLLCRFAPVLFGAEPKAFTSLLLRPQFASIDPLSVLPAIYAPRASALHRAEAMRYLEHVMRHHPEFSGQVDDNDGGTTSAFRSRSFLLESHLASCVGEDGFGLNASASGWASGTAVLNALIVLYACDCAEGHDPTAEETLLRFLELQEKNSLLDQHFALRVCSERGLVKAMVFLYGLMGMHEEAVEVALQKGDVALAKKSACKPSEDEKWRRQKLWLRLVEHEALTGDVQKITSLIRESQELTVRDVLPYMSDSMTIDAFQAEICECLDAYEGQIVTLRQEMDDHRRALQAFKEDLKQAEERCIVIAPDQACEICGSAAIRERFYAFACAHCYHEACLRALIVPTLAEDRKERLFALEATKLQHQAKAAGALASGGDVARTSLEKVEDELDGILAEDCPLCGRLMIETIFRPFIDPNEEAEIDSWAIK